MKIKKLTATILLFMCFGLSAQAQFKVIESSIQQGSTGVQEQGVLYLKFNAPINADTLVSLNPQFSFGKFSSSPQDLVLDGEVTVVDDSTLAIPYQAQANSRHVLYFFEIYSSDESFADNVVEPYALTFSTGLQLSERSVSGTLNFPEGHDEGAIVALIPRNQYTQNMITQPLAFARAAIYVPGGSSSYQIDHVPTGEYFAFAYGGKKPAAEPALLNAKPIGTYDLNEDMIADHISMGLFDSQINQVDIELQAIEFVSSGTDVLRDDIQAVAELWNPSAELIDVTALNPVTAEGASELWMWLFHTRNGESAFGIVSTGDQMLLAYPTGLDLNFFKAVGESWINSDIAVANALSIESEFLADKNDTTIFAGLSGGLRADFLYEDPIWRISLLADSARRVIYLDANTGEQISLDAITARDAFAILSDTVSSLAADAYLTVAFSSFEGAGGAAPVWIMDFYSESEDKYYSASTSGLGNPVVFSRPNLRGKIPYPLNENWLDSDAIMDSLENIQRYPGDENIKRAELMLAPFSVPFPADTITSWQVFARNMQEGSRPFAAVLVAETGQEYTLPVGTAKDWLSAAQTEAQSWSDDAQLIRINSFGGRTADENGQSEIWKYVYKSESLTDSVFHVFSADNQTRSYAIPVADSLLVDLPAISVVENLIDSDEAMAIAHSERDIENDPNIEYDFVGARMALDAIRVSQDSTIRVWSVYSPVRSLSRIGFARVVINAETGEILRDRINTTDRTPFEVAKSAAFEWKEDARLHYLSADSISEEGTVERWRFIFWSRSVTQAYEIIVEGGTDIVSEQVIEDLPNRFDPNRPLLRWRESVRAIARAFQEIGNSLKDAGELSKTSAVMAAPPSDNTISFKGSANGEEGSWFITFTTNDGNSETVEVNYSEQVLTSNEEINLPSSFELYQNYPNPFNPSTNIQFELAQSGQVRLEVFNILGQRVATLLNNDLKQAGVHTVTFDASNLASGMYIYRIQSGNYVQSRKMMLVK